MDDQVHFSFTRSVLKAQLVYLSFGEHMYYIVLFSPVKYAPISNYQLSSNLVWTMHPM
jgi:hypothetical protein